MTSSFGMALVHAGVGVWGRALRVIIAHAFAALANACPTTLRSVCTPRPLRLDLAEFIAAVVDADTRRGHRTLVRLGAR